MRRPGSRGWGPRSSCSTAGTRAPAAATTSSWAAPLPPTALSCAAPMPPHGRMSLVQQLLVRALVARFWKKPYTHKLVRWGTELHDRFLLPHFVRQDFQDVLEETRREGYDLRAEWFAPHFEFRF